ncbi:hypothetical protein PQE66_gp200 [Bacillus phage PBC2]|uniref:CBM-cenC domain-containing protein n=1 Tax=Bacillus phage PBC2 TaxID=1675029 RepID=A0A218KC78_9CAUD|nr:hypothetical protein PQE66_gp200 [Bacillus phage PBC2]AKQ08515.1 hypothetical protein PBC2_200 [Bacillus phage PBC2]
MQYENLSTSLKITTEKTDYVNAYTGIETPLNTYLAKMQETTDINGATFRTLFNTYYDKRAKLIKKINDVIQGNIDNVSIGGRNLLRNTGYVFSDLAEWTNYGTVISRVIGNEPTALSGKHLVVACKGAVQSGVHNRPVVELTVGETYSWTVYLKAGRNCRVTIGSEMGGTKTVDVTTTWQKFTHTFKAVSSSNKSFTFYYQQDGGADVNIYIHSAQLEQGDRNSATWTPAPEDYDKQLSALATRMDTAELKITDSAIVATVTKSTEFKGKADANTVYTKDELANMSTAQLLNNTEFTVDTSEWILATPSAGETIALDTGKQFEGVNSIKIDLGTRASNVWWGAISNYLPARPNQDFTASVYTNTDNMAGITNDATLEICFYDVNNVKLGTAGTTVKPTANNVWQRFSFTRTAPANTAKVRVWVHMVRTGRIWMAKPMLQYGTTMGAWTPSIGELGTDYKSKISQTAGRIDIVVGSDNKIKGEAIASAITMTPNAINMISNSINLTGKVTFSSLASSLQTDLNNYDSTRSKLETMTNGTTYINGGYIRSGTISGVTINVDTDLQVGKEIRLGSMTDFSLKMLRFNNSANISTTNGEIMNISSNITRIADGSVIIGNTMNTDVYTTILQGAVNVSGVTKWIGGVPAVFG